MRILDALLPRDRQLADEPVRIDGKAHALRQPQHGVPHRAPPQRETPSRLLAQHHVLRDGERRDEEEVLVDHADAERQRVLGAAEPHRTAVDANLPGVGPHQAGETFMSVDLPAPFSPTMATRSPGATRSEASSLATTPPYRFVMPRSSTSMLLRVMER